MKTNDNARGGYDTRSMSQYSRKLREMSPLLQWLSLQQTSPAAAPVSTARAPKPSCIYIEHYCAGVRLTSILRALCFEYVINSVPNGLLRHVSQRRRARTCWLWVGAATTMADRQVTLQHHCNLTLNKSKNTAFRVNCISNKNKTAIEKGT